MAGWGVEAFVIVNRALARQLWPEGEAVGQHIRFGEKPIEVIAVAGDVRQESLATPARPALYVPNALAPHSTMKIFVRTAGDPLSAAGAVRGAIREVDGNQPISDLAPLSQQVSEAVGRPRFTTLLLGLFTRWLSGLLYGISTTDPLAFLAAPLALGLVALYASYLPARRAAGLDPLVALRRD